MQIWWWWFVFTFHLFTIESIQSSFEFIIFDWVFWFLIFVLCIIFIERCFVLSFRHSLFTLLIWFFFSLFSVVIDCVVIYATWSIWRRKNGNDSPTIFYCYSNAWLHMCHDIFNFFYFFYKFENRFCISLRESDLFHFSFHSFLCLSRWLKSSLSRTYCVTRTKKKNK